MLTAFGLWFLLGCGRNSTCDDGAPPRSPPQPTLSRADLVEELREPTTKNLFQAASLGNVNDVKFYVRRDPESVRLPNAVGLYPIHLAASQGRSEVIRVLLRVGPT